MEKQLAYLCWGCEPAPSMFMWETDTCFAKVKLLWHCISFRQKIIVNFGHNPFICLPTQKKPHSYRFSKQPMMATVKLAKVPEKCVRAQDGDSLQTVISPNVSICRGNGLLYCMDVA